MAGYNRRYPDVNRTAVSILGSALVGGSRVFARDARAMIDRLDPPLRLIGSYPTHSGDGMILAMNHYSRPGFGAWWIALAVAATCPWSTHWIATEAWVYDDPMRSLLITPASRWLLRRLARSYGFTSMPAMPPRPQDVERRALAVRRILKHVEHTPSPVLCLAPEGADSEDGQLSSPPPGVGRFLAQLLKRGLGLLPLGVFEAEGGLVLAIGSPLELSIPPDRHAQDHDLANAVMQAIAQLLPVNLRGPYR